MDIVTVKAIAGDLQGIVLHGRINKEDNSFVVYGCKLEDKIKFMERMKKIIYKNLGERLETSEVEKVLDSTDMTYKIKKNDYEIIKE